MGQPAARITDMLPAVVNRRLASGDESVPAAANRPVED